MQIKTVSFLPFEFFAFYFFPWIVSRRGPPVLSETAAVMMCFLSQSLGKTVNISLLSVILVIGFFFFFSLIDANFLNVGSFKEIMIS